MLPNAKINIGLYIISKREDGYHNINSVFYPVNLCDVLEIFWESAPENKLEITLTSPLPNDAVNSCQKIYNYLIKDSNLNLEGTYHIRATLHKSIPIGGGMGGGTSDAVSFLKFLSWLYNIEEDLNVFSLKIGADGPFFLFNSPAFVTGIGEVSKILPDFLTKYATIIVYPGFEISTKYAYSKITPKHFSVPTFYPEIILTTTPENWKGKVYNVFEEVLFSEFQVLAKIKSILEDNYCLYASLTGSGSTIYGIYEPDEKKIPVAIQKIKEICPMATIRIIMPEDLF